LANSTQAAATVPRARWRTTARTTAACATCRAAGDAATRTAAAPGYQELLPAAIADVRGAATAAASRGATAAPTAHAATIESAESVWSVASCPTDNQGIRTSSRDWDRGDELSAEAGYTTRPDTTHGAAKVERGIDGPRRNSPHLRSANVAKGAA
jgi:hypothetical protein